MKRWLAAILAAMLALGGVFAMAEEALIEAEPIEITLAAPEAAENRADDAAIAEPESAPEAAEERIEDNASATSDPDAAVKIDKKRFPDARFRTVVAKRIDTDGDGLLSREEADLAVILDVSGKGIAKLKGIQYFTKLEYLYCQKNKLSELDVTGCPSLRYLDCGNNRLTKLALGEKAMLEYLDCGDNKLTKLDVTGCPALAELDCGGNRLTKLNVSRCPALAKLNCGDNRLTKLNVKKNASLAWLDCHKNRLGSIDVSKNKALSALICQGNRIGSFDLQMLPVELRALSAREDLREWTDSKHYWVESDERCLVLPASANVTDGKKLMYRKGYYLGHKKVKTKRKEFKGLSDTQYANFRNVATTGMGKNALYRGANPVNSRCGRTKQAMKALKAAGIRTVINMSDSMKSVKKSSAYKRSYYATTAVWANAMTSKFQSKSFRKHIPGICRFMIENEGPYYVHCIWGKDRTGFLCALLECLMGASGEEVVGDYLITYYNYYGVRPGSSTGEYIGYNRIRHQLAHAFGVGSIMDPEVDLSACAEKYLRKCGLSKEEIAQLKARLAADY